MIVVTLPADAGFDAWRLQARGLVAAGVAPDDISWRTRDAPDLFGEDAPTLALSPAPVSAPRAFIDMAQNAVLHTDPERFALLYRLLWRLQRHRALMEDAADPDVARAQALAKAVGRDIHKMHAFVRFREVAHDDGPRFVAWFEPQFNITLATADFFARRFAGMRWSIVTPQASMHWDGATLTFGPGGVRSDVPPSDARDEDWRTYYESMFNPARLKVRAMKREMPLHYWRNLPEAQSITRLIQSASHRTDTMVDSAPTTARKRAGAAHAAIAPVDLPTALRDVADHREPPDSIDALRRALGGCRACPLWRDATQAVPGEGVTTAPLIALVGEQPGDQEDLAGRPFVGPAGKLLDRALAVAGVARDTLYVTNAVKHFKHEPRGNKRLHKRPDRAEVEVCRWWVKHELDLVAPKLVVALGVTALQSLSSHKGSLASVRGAALTTREGLPLRATIHPSALLRLPDDADKDAEFDRLVQDLRDAWRIAAAA